MIAENNICQCVTQNLPDPLSNTGSDSHPPTETTDYVTARIDSVSLLWEKWGSGNILLALTRYLGVRIGNVHSVGRKIGLVWDRTWSSVCGCLLSERDGAGGKVYVRLSLSGEACGRVDSARLGAFLVWCHRRLSHLKCSRLDIAIDDFGKRLDLEDLQSACEEGNHFGFKESKSTVNYGGKFGGYTVNLGSRHSNNYIRVYDKNAESKGEINAQRFEAEKKAELANEIFLLLIQCPFQGRKYQQNLIDLAIGGIGFIDKQSKNLSRNLLLDWWEEWLDYLHATPIRPHVRRYRTNIGKKKDWLERSAAKSLALLIDALGQLEAAKYINKLISGGRLRYKEIDELILAEYRETQTYLEREYDIIVL